MEIRVLTESVFNLKELFTSAIDFLKLEKIEIGSPRGKTFSEEIHYMNEEFHESWKVLQESKYDPLDYNNMVHNSISCEYTIGICRACSPFSDLSAKATTELQL